MQIIERELPALFGGRSTDYQLIEAEDSRGLPRLELRVSPRVGTVDEHAVRDRFLTLLRHGERSPESWAQSGVEMWKQSGTLQISRNEPLSTASGKILPFYLEKAKSNHEVACVR